ncbi:MAG: glycosyltransferase family 2 protein, partial [Trichodesmium sp. St4_bin8_1]|nr:glycosyltransferase family 2 protein [Trichodesmium sp. St4_bin8_1]
MLPDQNSQSVQMFVQTYDRNLGEIYDELFWGYEIKYIKEQIDNEDIINISGWVLGKKCPIVAVEVASLRHVVKKVSVNESYPDIVKFYTETSQGAEIGFNIDFIADKLPPKFNWLIQAVFADETRIPIGCIQSYQEKSLNVRKTPLITKKAIEFLEKFFQEKPHAKVLEFGSGASTIWLSKLTQNLTSIEHDARWFQEVKNQIQLQKNCHPVDIQLLARPYHKICEKFAEESFDLIIVDGRDRMKCFEASIKLLKPGGILMLDDAQRGKYKQAQDLLQDWQLTKTVSNPRHTYWWEKPFEQRTVIGKSQSISNQRPISQKIKENVVIAGVSIVKDEEDIIYYNLAGNYREGIKHFVMLDHMSSDGTRDEIRRFADDYPEAMVYLIEDRDPLFHKFRKMSAAAEFAHRMWGAEWIFPFDADEVMSSS